MTFPFNTIERIICHSLRGHRRLHNLHILTFDCVLLILFHFRVRLPQLYIICSTGGVRTQHRAVAKTPLLRSCSPARYVF